MHAEQGSCLLEQCPSGKENILQVIRCLRSGWRSQACCVCVGHCVRVHTRVVRVFAFLLLKLPVVVAVQVFIRVHAPADAAQRPWQTRSACCRLCKRDMSAGGRVVSFHCSCRVSADCFVGERDSSWFPNWSLGPASAPCTLHPAPCVLGGVDEVVQSLQCVQPPAGTLLSPDKEALLPVDVQSSWSAEDVSVWLRFQGVGEDTVQALQRQDVDGSDLSSLYYDAFHKTAARWIKVGVYRGPEDWPKVEEVFVACHDLEDHSWLLRR